MWINNIFKKKPVLEVNILDVEEKEDLYYYHGVLFTGKLIVYDEVGNIEVTVPCSKGHVIGPYIQYYKSGAIHIKKEFVNNDLNNETCYFENGLTQYVIGYQDGRIIIRSDYYPSGKIKKILSFIDVERNNDDVPYGVETTYGENGKKISERQVPEIHETVNPDESNYDERKRSLELISSKLNCNINDAKEIYFQKMDELNPNDEDISSTKKHLLIKSSSEADQYGMGPLNTPSAIYYQWTIEYADKKINDSKTNHLSNLEKNNKLLFQKLITAQQADDKVEMEKLLRENPDLLDNFLSGLTDDPDRVFANAFKLDDYVMQEQAKIMAQQAMGANAMQQLSNMVATRPVKKE